MADENKHENKLKQCLENIIKTVSDAAQNPNEDVKDKITKIVDDNRGSLNAPCRGYLLDAVGQFNPNDSAGKSKDHLHAFLVDLQGRFDLIGAAQAAWIGDETIVKQFIQNHPALKNKSGPRGTTLLYAAARNNHFNLVKYLVTEGRVSVNARNEEYPDQGHESPIKPSIGSTALHAACYHGVMNTIKYLIAHGSDYFILNSVYESPVDNGQSRRAVQKFFVNLLLSGYSRDLSGLPNKTVLREIDEKKEPIVDCFWEFKPLTANQWFPYASDLSDILQGSLDENKVTTDVALSTTRDAYRVSMIKFLRSGPNNSQTENLAWIRCRGSSLLNFHCYARWQLMVTEHPTAVSNSSTLLQIADMASASPMELGRWYNMDSNVDFLFETAMNYRRRYLNVKLDFFNREKVTFNLEKFTFTNRDHTIEGFLRWIPKLIPATHLLTVLDNFQVPKNAADVALLTIATMKKAELNSKNSSEALRPYRLTYESAFQNDDLDFIEKKSTGDGKDISHLLHVDCGDLIKTKSDVIVICISSQYLFDSVLKAAGEKFKDAYECKRKTSKKEPLISVPTNGTLPCKAVYFASWNPDPNEDVLRDSFESLVSNIMDRALQEKYTSIAFPAIGCGEYGCPIPVVAQALVSEVQRCLLKQPMTVTFVIQPNKHVIYNEFQKQIDACKQQGQHSITVGQGIVSVEKGSIIDQQVDAIIGSSSSENLRQVLIKAGGKDVTDAYEREYANNPHSLIISTPAGELPCKRVFFVRWEPDKDPEILRQSVSDLISNVIQTVGAHHFTSIAFPALGCGEHACSVDIVVKTMVRKMTQQIRKRNLPWTVKFIVQPNQQNVYDEFCRQLLSSDESAHGSADYQLPSTWQGTQDDKIRFLVPSNTEEYKSIINDFRTAMHGNCKQVIRLERIQNERWYMQYLAHARDFKKRLNEDTEKRLYHGCPETAADAIIQDCFNRSFAGVNGTAYGFGVYFSTNAVYSHGYAKVNGSGERCMFVSRVLVGRTTLGNSSMKTRPVGFDSTTDGNHMTVTYHDAQAYAEYLITYK